MLTDQARAALQAERDDLEHKASRRRDEPGFADNVADIDRRLAEIDALLAGV